MPPRMGRPGWGRPPPGVAGFDEVGRRGGRVGTRDGRDDDVCGRGPHARRQGPARALRRAGRVPAVIYGEDKAQAMVSLEARALRRAAHRPAFLQHPLRPEVDGELVRVLPRDVQLHPVTDYPIHADFVRVSAGARVTVEVPVVFINEDSARAQARRRPQHRAPRPRAQLPGRCDPGRDRDRSFAVRPRRQRAHLARPPAGGGAPAITDRDFTIVTIAAPTVVREAAEEAAAAAEAEAEPEATSE